MNQEIKFTKEYKNEKDLEKKKKTVNIDSG